MTSFDEELEKVLSREGEEAALGCRICQTPTTQHFEITIPDIGPELVEAITGFKWPDLSGLSNSNDNTEENSSMYEDLDDVESALEAEAREAAKSTKKALRKALKKVRSTKLADGTVVRWTSGGRFNYAAIYIAAMGAWYVTGEGRFYGGNVISAEDFVESVLKTADKVFIATDWEEL